MHISKNNPKIVTHTSPSGLQSVLLQKENSLITSTNLAYRVGSKNEITGKTGIAHLFEHLMFEGTHNLPRGEFDKMISKEGGTNNAYTTYDYTAYTMTVPSTKLELALWLESDRMYNLNLTQEALDNQKSVVIEEIKQTMHNRPYAKWREELAKNAYSKDCSYSWEVAGSIDDVANFDLSDLQLFYSTNYSPENAYLSIVGSMDIEKTIQLIDKYFIQTKENKLNKILFDKNYLLEQSTSTLQDEVPLNAVFLGFHCEGFAEDLEVYISSLFCTLASSGKSSPMQINLTHKTQIASTVGVFLDKREFDSILTFYIVANLSETNCEVLYEALVNEIKKMKESGFEVSDFERSKNMFTTNLAMEFQRTSGLADSLSFTNMFFKEPERTFDLLERYENITSDEINDFVKNKIDLEKAIRIDVVKKD